MKIVALWTDRVTSSTPHVGNGARFEHVPAFTMLQVGLLEKAYTNAEDAARFRHGELSVKIQASLGIEAGRSWRTMFTCDASSFRKDPRELHCSSALGLYGQPRSRSAQCLLTVAHT